MPSSTSLRAAFPRTLAASLLALGLATSTQAGQVYSKPPSAAGGVNASSWLAPDGSDSDMYAWDDFTLPTTQTITEVRWRGAYALGTPYSRVNDFRISFFDSVAGDFQPLIVALPEHESQEIVIATFHTGNDANETPAGVYGGLQHYDYRFVLPTPVTLTGGVKYWFRVVAAQSAVYPDWGMTSSDVGDGSYFRYSTGLHMFQNVPHNLSFSLHARWEDLGHALAGSAGLPRLVGTGTVAGGASNTLTLSQARPSATAFLVLGPSAVNIPMRGGVLVPYPRMVVSLSTNAAGVATWSFTLSPTFPPGVELYMQAWMSDPAAVRRWSASNGLACTTQ